MTKLQITIISILSLLVVGAGILIFLTNSSVFSTTETVTNANNDTQTAQVASELHSNRAVALEEDAILEGCDRTFQLDWDYKPEYTLTVDGNDVSDTTIPGKSITLQHKEIAVDSNEFSDLPKAYLSWSCVPKSYPIGEEVFVNEWSSYVEQSRSIDIQDVPLLEENIKLSLVEARIKEGYLSLYYLLDNSGAMYIYDLNGLEVLKQENVKILLT